MRKPQMIKGSYGLREILQNQRHSCVACVTVALEWISKTSLSIHLGCGDTHQEAGRNFSGLGEG